MYGDRKGKELEAMQYSLLCFVWDVNSFKSKFVAVSVALATQRAIF